MQDKKAIWGINETKQEQKRGAELHHLVGHTKFVSFVLHFDCGFGVDCDCESAAPKVLLDSWSPSRDEGETIKRGFVFASIKSKVEVPVANAAE